MGTERFSEPDVIKKLDEDTINRIAAGEIIVRPANAVKEMLENSLDAKSTNIQISAKCGGLKFLQIQDNGTGIRKDDLTIVCDRFTTSKLQNFEDLTTISTFGFRGEALCSISHVAHLSIQTKTASEKCAYKASYASGHLKAPPKPCAGNQGTQITVEDMFYNMPQRKNIYKSATDEFNRIYDVVSKYAIHYPSIAFTLNKLGEKMVLRTPANTTTSKNIAIVYGADVAKYLKPIELNDTVLQFRMNGYYTDAPYSSPRREFLFFFNHRLVDSTTLRDAIDKAFKTYIPRGQHPFVYVSLEMDSHNVDVNIHPTKHELKFLHEEVIMDHIRVCFEKALALSMPAQRAYIQQLLPGAPQPDLISGDSERSADDRVYDRYLIRSDAKAQKIEQFFGSSVLIPAVSSQSNMSTTSSQQGTPVLDDQSNQFESDPSEGLNRSSRHNETSESVLDPIPSTSTDAYADTDTVGEDTFTDNAITASQNIINSSLNETIQKATNHDRFRVTRRINNIKLTSILSLRKRIEDDCHPTLRKILSDSVFVGAVDRELTLFQHEQKLYLCNLQKLSEEVFYQLVLYDFGNFETIALDEPLSIAELALAALDTEDSGWTDEDGRKEELAERVSEILVEKSAMLREYFAIGFTENGYLDSLPALLSNHVPAMCRLPLFVLRIASEVDWDNEQRCFRTMAREMAAFYSYIPMYVDEHKWKWTIEHVMHSAIKQYLLPSNKFNDITLQVASLSNLYRVFERC